MNESRSRPVNSVTGRQYIVDENGTLRRRHPKLTKAEKRALRKKLREGNEK